MTTPTLTWTQKIIYHQSQSHNSRIISYAPPTTVNRSQPRNTRHRKEKGIKYSKIFCLLIPPLVVDTLKSSIFIASTFDSWIAGFFFFIDSISLRRRKKILFLPPPKMISQKFSILLRRRSWWRSRENQVRAVNVNWKKVKSISATRNTFNIKITSANKRAYDCKYVRYAAVQIRIYSNSLEEI